MSDVFDRISQLSPKRLALLAMELQAKVDAAGGDRSEPIAIIGMACRFPGADTPEAYWQLLRDGVDAITEIPPTRWDVDEYYDPDPDTPGGIATRWGGFIDDIDRFEPQLFGISPREAQSLDPQQRLLLEVTWEALERAGIAPDSLSGSATGAFVGICNGDYGHMLMEGSGTDFDMYLATGTAYSVASGRLSYVLGLNGPAVSVDSACSSSMLSVHLAVQSLRDRACRMALAGGANAILSPKTTMVLSRAKMMAPDGRCKPFDAAADGFVRGEGCGMVVLKRLSDAVADRDRILAVIRGSAVNQDGRSNGLTAPNGPSQVSVIRAALADASVEPARISYVETHGTGTSLGDPIEAQALGVALGTGRTSRDRLLIGSAKANIGHLESAAGVAGLIKVVLSMQHGEVAPLLHLHEPSPHIAWDALPIDLPTTLTPWGDDDGARFAGVSSFGFSGTNVHMILESAPATAARHPSPDRPRHVVTLSARTDSALREQARGLARALALEPTRPLADVAYTLGVGRADLAQRLALVGADTNETVAALAAFGAGEAPANVVTGVAAGREPGVAFLFTGHGAQYPNMGRELYDTQPVFRGAIDECAELLAPHMTRPLRDALFTDDARAATAPDDMASSQPALFAVEYALATLWQSWGVRPTTVAGHSVGEYVAAVVAGAMGLEDGLRLVAARGRLMSTLPPDGEMAAVLASEERVRAAIAPHGDNVSVAAINGPESIAISGTKAAVAAVVAELRGAGVEVRPLAIPVAAHSPQVDPILDEFERVAATVTYREPSVDVISGTTGRLAAGDDLTTATYWRRHLREPVRFADAFSAIYERGLRVFIETGPHPTLLGMGRHVLPEDECVWLPSLRNGHDEWEQILDSVADLYVAGGTIDWRGFDAPYDRRRVELPTYPFERERYWAVASGSPAVRRSGGKHALLGRRLRSPAVDDVVYESALGATWPSYLDHHRIFGVALMPSPAYIEMAFAAADDALGGGPWTIQDFTIREALILPDEGERIVQLVMSQDGDGARFEIFGADRDDWTLHAGGRLSAGRTVAESPDRLNRTSVQGRCDTHVTGTDYYAELRALGLEFGEGFRGLVDVWRREGEALGRVVLPDSLVSDARGYTVHPALLDACFHLLGAPLPEQHDDVAYLLIAIDELRVHTSPGTSVWNHTVLRPGFDAGGETFVGDIRLYDDDGGLVAEVLGIHLKLADRAALLRATRRASNDWTYDVQWRPAAIDPPAANDPGAEPSGWIIVADAGDVGRTLTALLEQRGEKAMIVAGAETFAGDPADRDRGVDHADVAAFTALIDSTPAGRCHVVDLRGLDIPAPTSTSAEAITEAATTAVTAALALAQATIAASGTADLWIATRGAQPTGTGPLSPAGAPLWGLGRVFALEHPDRWGALVDLAPESTPDEDAAALLAEIDAGGGEDQVALRRDGRRVARLVRTDTGGGGTFEWRPDAGYLITGGLGGLGLKVARWMAEQGARTLVLASRSGFPARAEWDALPAASRAAAQAAEIRAIEAIGATVHTAAVDIADRTATEALLSRFGNDLPPLRGVLHAAAALSNWPIATMPPAELGAMLRPKVTGTWLLHELTSDIELDFFVLFSSTTALWGSRDLAHYAAANQFLDTFAHFRHEHGLPALSINWGTWDEMRVASQEEQRNVASLGLEQMPSADALGVLGDLLGRDDIAQIAVAAVDWDTLKTAYESRRARPMLALVESRHRAPDPHGATEQTELLHRLEGAAGPDRYDLVVGYLRDEVARSLAIASPDSIDTGQGLFEMGMDSLMSVELKGRISAAVGVTLPSTLTFNYPTIDALAHFLTEQVLDEAEADDRVEAEPRAAANQADAASDLDDLSEDDLAAMLAARLGKS